MKKLQTHSVSRFSSNLNTFNYANQVSNTAGRVWWCLIRQLYHQRPAPPPSLV